MNHLRERCFDRFLQLLATLALSDVKHCPLHWHMERTGGAFESKFAFQNHGPTMGVFMLSSQHGSPLSRLQYYYRLDGNLKRLQSDEALKVGRERTIRSTNNVCFGRAKFTTIEST